MFPARIPTGILITSSILLLFIHHSQNANSVVQALNNIEGTHRQHRPLPRIGTRIPIRYNKVRPETVSDIFDEDDLFDLSKRLVTDDYGHLRFGKRGEDFDDYGHLRFGRSGTEIK